MILHLHLALDYLNSSSSSNCDYQATVMSELFERLHGTVKAEKISVLLFLIRLVSFTPYVYLMCLKMNIFPSGFKCGTNRLRFRRKIHSNSEDTRHDYIEFFHFNFYLT